MISQVVVLCAGRGRRLYPLTKELPKPLLEVGGLPYVEHSIRDLIEVGIQDIVLLVEYLKDQFTYLREKYSPYVRIYGADRKVNRGVLRIPSLRSSFCILNGDCYPIVDWKHFLDSEGLVVCVQMNGKDAGCAIVSAEWVRDGLIDCGSFSKMKEVLKLYRVSRNLGIGSLESLEKTRTYFTSMRIHESA